MILAGASRFDECEYDEDTFDLLTSYATLYGAAPLHYASMINAASLVQWLLANECEVNQASCLGTPLHCSILRTNCMTISAFAFDASLNSDLNVDDLTLMTTDALVNAGADCTTSYVNEFSKKAYSIIKLLLRIYNSDEEVIKKFCILILGSNVKIDHDSLGMIRELIRMKNMNQSAKILLDCIKIDNIAESLQSELLQLSASIGSSLPSRWLADSAQSMINTTETHITLAAMESSIIRDDVEGLKSILANLHFDPETILPGEVLPALHIAAKRDSFDSATMLLDLGASVHQEDGKGRTALHHCAKSNFPGLARLLLAKHAILHHADRNGRTVFHDTLSSNSTTMLETLLGHPDFHLNLLWQKSSVGKSPLQEAVDNSADDALLMIINRVDGLMDYSHDSPFHSPEQLIPLWRVFNLFLRSGMDLKLPTVKKSSLLNTYLMKCETPSRASILLLIEHGCVQANVDAHGRTPLHYLLKDKRSRGEDLQDLIPALTTFGSIEMKDVDDCTPLHYFLRNRYPYSKNLTNLKVLLEHGASLETLDGQGKTCFELLFDSYPALRSDGYGDHFEEHNIAALFVEILTKVPSYWDIVKRKPASESLLVWAAITSQTQLLDLLLGQEDSVSTEILEGVLIKSVDKSVVKKILAKANNAVLSVLSLDSGHSILHTLCSDRSTADPEILASVLCRGCNVNVLSQHEEKTPVMCAAESGKYEHVKLLIEHKADLNVSDRKGWKAIHFAVASNHVNISKLLSLSAGSHFGRWESIAIHFFIEKSSFLVKGGNLIHLAIGGVEILEFVLQNCHHTSIDDRDAHGSTPLHVAAVGGNPEVLKALISHGASPYLMGFEGWSSLHYAALGGNEEVVQTLLDLGVDLNKVDCLGRLPLHCAAAVDKPDAVRLLLNAGSRLPADNNGITPETAALMNSHFAIANVIGQGVTSSSEYDSRICNYFLIWSGAQTTPYLTRTLENAILSNNLALTEKILQSSQGFDSGQDTCKGCGPLFAALIRSRPSTAKIILEKGAHTVGIMACPKTDRIWWAPLALAANNPSMVEVLRSMLATETPGDYHLGYDVHPLYAAIAGGNYEGLQILIQHYLCMVSDNSTANRHHVRISMIKPNTRIKLLPEMSIVELLIVNYR